MKHKLTRAAALSLALLTLLSAALVGCRNTPAPTEDTTAPRESTTESLPIETETDEPDAFENTLLLAADGQTAYTVVVPDYAAAWELAAAKRLAATFSELGVTVTPAVDTTTEATAKEIVVGYTNRKSELADDFYAVGTAGYHVAAMGEKLFIGANTEAGMTAALERLAADLISDGNRLAIKEGYVCKAVDESEPIAAPTLSGAYAESIAYANQTANGVQGYYTNGSRGGFTMENLNMTITSELVMGGNLQISELLNADGIPYLRDTMSAYVVADGQTFYSKDSMMGGRVNIYRYGAYYYETHILGQDFGNSRLLDETVEPFDLIAAAKSFGGNNTTVKKNRDNNTLTVTVREAADPYFNFEGSLAIPTSQYDAIQLTIRTESCSSGQIYLAAGSHGGIDGAQNVSFNLTPDGETHTYLIALDGVADYTGNITAFRLDLNGEAKEKIFIEEVKAVKTKPSGVPAVAMDRTLHTYSDKLHQEIHFVATYPVENMTAYGVETAIDKSRVKSFLVIDGKGEHTSLDGVDWATVTAVAFDVDRAGVMGFILPIVDGVGQITVSERDGCYIVDQKQSAKDSYGQFEEFYLGHRLYTDATHSFDGFRKAHREEREALTVTVTSKNFDGKAIGYDAMRGAYRLELQGTGFNEAYYQNPDLHYRVDVQVTGDSADRNVYLYTNTVAGALECAVLLDEQSRVLPYVLQVCKNFQGENEEPLFDKGDISYGEVYFPMTVKSGETVSFSVLNLYQNWGKFPLKQISSIQFVAPYYHLSTGVTETNCIAPYYVYGKDKWTLPDFRSMSAPLWAGQPQHTSAGRLYFLEYTDGEGNTYASESTVDEIISHGPVYSDIWMSYLSDDGRISVDYRHLEMPQTDENRTYYQIRMTVLEDISFKNFKKDFSFFSMDGRAVVYETLGYLDENNQPVVTAANETGRETYYTLGKNAPFVSYSYAPNSSDYVNMAAVIKGWEITVGGEAYEGSIILSDVTKANLNYARLTLDLEEVTFKAGDVINIDLILMPWGSYNTAQDDISNVLNVRNDTCLDPIKTEVKTGTLLADPYMPQIRAADNAAEFTLSGADNHMAVRVYGFESYAKPTIEEYVNGAWVAYDTASENGYDGYTVYYDGDGTYSFAFIVDMSGDASRTFRVKQ